MVLRDFAFFITFHFTLICFQLDLRRKQFHVLISAIHDLEGILEGKYHQLRVLAS